MSDDDAFIEEIRRQPHDTAPRLVYADYLEDCGDPRGELIRVQCQLAELPLGDPARPALVAREGELLRRHGEEWLRPLRDLGVEGATIGCFRRRLIERVTIAAETFGRRAEELCRTAPGLTSVELRRPREATGLLATLSLPAQIEDLDLGAGGLEPASMREVHAAPWLEQVLSLQLPFNRLLDDGIAALTQAACPRLLRLNLSTNRIGPAGLQQLATWPALAHIEELDLSVNRFGDFGLQALCQGAATAGLRRLNLSSCDLRTLEPLAKSGWPSLEHVVVRSNRIGQDDWAVLRESALWRRLKSLDGRNNPGVPTPPA